MLLFTTFDDLKRCHIERTLDSHFLNFEQKALQMFESKAQRTINIFKFEFAEVFTNKHPFRDCRVKCKLVWIDVVTAAAVVLQVTSWSQNALLRIESSTQNVKCFYRSNSLLFSISSYTYFLTDMESDLYEILLPVVDFHFFNQSNKVLSFWVMTFLFFSKVMESAL